MKTSLKAGFAQIFSCCPKNLSCPKFGGAAAPLAPPRPVRLFSLLFKYFSLYGYFKEKSLFNLDPANESNNMTSQLCQITSLCQLSYA